MCTLSVITRNNGYLLAMNRDERIARGAGTLLELHQVNGTTAIYPSDGVGGTWIAANEYGITLALLNWNDPAPNGTASVRTRSRGRVIPALINSRSLLELYEVLRISHFMGMQAFRLVGVFPSEPGIWEWRWDSAQLESKVHEWKPQHWFSSSLSDEGATSFRGAACREAHLAWDAGSPAWLRRLHASHAGGPGPFSLCVHRDDVKTLSYSEVIVTGGKVHMGHSLGTSCSGAQIHSTEIERAACLLPSVTDVSSSRI